MADITDLQEPTLRGLFLPALDRFTSRPAVTFDGRTWSYAEIVGDANRLAHALAAAGIAAGTPVALVMGSCAEYVVADQALVRCGGAKVPVNSQLAAGEIAFILRDSGAQVAIVDDAALDIVVAADAPALREIIVIGHPRAGARSWEVTLAPHSSDAPPQVEIRGSDVALIAYTGGTTGRQKGVMHSQRGLRDNLLAHVIEIGLLDDERLLLNSPLPHSAGYLLQAGMLKGAHHFLDSRYDPGAVLDRIERDRITFLFLVPTMIYRLLDTADGRQVDLSSLRTILYGAAPITIDRLRQGLHRFGPVFMQLYGQTEAPNFLTRLTREDHDPDRPERLTSCGRPAAMVTIAILDAEGRPVPDGRPGEVCARAPYVMAGYLGLPDKTSQTLAGGWLHTGDIGTLDADGYLHLLDRKNDMIISGGMNVYSAEVENVLQHVPGIVQVAVVGQPHPDWGEAVVAFVVPGPRGFDEAAAIAACKTDLAPYKRPKSYRRIDSLPVTAVGKIDKKALRTVGA
ncbi:AMP-binding protein [Rhodococcus opacus]|uniref:AMP-binding protein n=1 Tax=Rhodococcus opacus TaxID=37919 RepID=A0AAX3YQ95_RHOOP|nr:AMP-binding protein [Rhodococcus opacus]MCZ4587616.1 AMP-binding protein [Rhodococcus opacus]WLF51388.1 AMP-binding protein [Rhodococcus opacus]